MPNTLSAATQNAAPDVVAQAHARLLKAGDLQFVFPAFQKPKPPDWIEAIGRFLKSISPYLLDLFWIVLAALVLVLAYYMGRELLSRRGWWTPKQKEAPAPWPEWRPAPEQARLLLADADRLAQDGRFREAAHLLLLRSIQDVDDQRPQLVRPALTTREIARLTQVPQSARDCFGDIAQTVERSLFGGRDVTQQEFMRCREAYQRFALPQVWRGEQAA
jgi:hypothetical protein